MSATASGGVLHAEAGAGRSLRVSDLEGLGRCCAQRIADAMGTHRIGFSRAPSARGHELLRLSGEGATTAQAERPYPVVLFLASGSRTYWLAVSLEFEYHLGAACLTSVSLVVFEGRATDESKTPLIRAEWACGEQGAQGAHAQPHWHVYPGQLPVTVQPTGADFEAAPRVQQFQLPATDPGSDTAVPSGWERGDRFHFAMASRWHSEGRASHKVSLPDETALLEWLEGCLAYTRAELLFIAGTPDPTA